ncbi:MAG: histidine phosphatase family protein, partial [Muribaculaceae bacterium]|nr:histidine phosphatase family protein [Muribaculaceae bacterium]
MKIQSLLFSLLALMILSSGQTVSAERTLPAILDGSMTLYDFSAVEPSAIPDTLIPVHISYIARHGARYLTSESKILSVEKILNHAKANGTLTAAGRDCLKLMEQVRTATAGRWGLLSPIGKEQEIRLGKEMVQMYPQIFGTNRVAEPAVTAVSSYVPRVIETMDHFIIPLAESTEGISISTSSGRRYDHLTRFFVADPDYAAWREHGDWKAIYDRFVAETIPVAPAQRLAGTNSGLSDKELRRLVYDLYKVLQGLRAMGLPAPTDRWMSETEYAACWQATNLEKYFQYSISTLSTLPAQGASQVLFHLLQTQTALENALSSLNLQSYPSKSQSESVLKSEIYRSIGNEFGMDGIFGHAETLLPIFSLLGVPGATALPDDWKDLPEVWSDADLTPLAANLAIIYSTDSRGNLYASMRLNGRNVSP